MGKLPIITVTTTVTTTNTVENLQLPNETMQFTTTFLTSTSTDATSPVSNSQSETAWPLTSLQSKSCTVKSQNATTFEEEKNTAANVTMMSVKAVSKYK
jgi:hypothetical protein